MKQNAAGRIAVLLALAVVAIAIAARPARATTIVEPVGSSLPYQQWVNESLVPTPPGEIVVSGDPSRCLPAPACTAPGEPIYLGLSIFAEAEEHPGRGMHPWRELRERFYHELGHQFDYRVLSEADRDDFRALIGDSREWDSAPSSPKEQFAVAYETCSMERTLTDWPHPGLGFGYDYHPSRTEYLAACRLIRHAGQVLP